MNDALNSLVTAHMQEMNEALAEINRLEKERDRMLVVLGNASTVLRNLTYLMDEEHQTARELKWRLETPGGDHPRRFWLDCVGVINDANRYANQWQHTDDEEEDAGY